MLIPESVEQSKPAPGLGSRDAYRHTVGRKCNSNLQHALSTVKAQRCSGGLLPFAAVLRLANAMTYLLLELNVTALA